MSYLEELLPEFRKGAKIRRTNWSEDKYIQLSKDKKFIIDENDKIYTTYAEELLAANWELYREPQPDWDYIIKHRCLCWFWDLDTEYKTIGFLKKWTEGIDYPFSNETDGGYYINCSPICKDEATFYEEKKEDKQEESSYTIGSYDPRHGIYAGMCAGKQIWIWMQDAPKEMNWDDAKKYCEELDVVLGWHLPTKEELMLIYVNKDIINKALEEHGGESMRGYWFWSSSEYNNYNAWGMHFTDSLIYSSNKNGYTYCVRPVLAL